MVIAYQMAMTILIIFFGQCSEKAYYQHFKTLNQESGSAELDLDNNPSLVRASTRFASYLSRRRGITSE
jgi:hypothetical protein